MGVPSLPGFGELAPLAEGDESMLFRGRRLEDDAAVVLKLPAASAGARAVRHLRREWLLAEPLHGAWGVRPVYSLLELPGGPVLVCAAIAGRSLDELIGHGLPLRRALELARQLAAVLAEVHARQVIHKDVKPQNLLVDEADKLWLIDFGSATRLLEEQPGPRALRALEGSLPYLSPEQTGRMNRSIDQRSDLYALGVTLYQMLTGRLPFTGGDALAWVHSHLALAPVPPRQLEPELPPVVEELVLKLLAKSADERYQSAASLEADLARCLAQLEERGEVAPFALGQSERGGRFRLPQRLYGRESERAALEEAFTRMVASGEAALALVGGYSGTGKSSLVQELYRPITACGGLFASGKFDQLSRDVPYATLVQALRGLVRDLLTLEEAELRGWKERLRTALGTHVRLMVDLIPELALLTGPGEPIPAVGPAEARNRFHFAFRGFIQAFATPAHPLTLFLDDMQWADPSTYDFVTAMLCEGGMHHLLVILAWRDNEVDAAHPFSVHLARLRREGPLRCELRLGPLEREHVASLLEDALGCAPRECASLAERVHRQTGGIPFFVLQFLRALHRDGLLVYDGSAWRWDDEAIARRGYTDNVIDLLRERLFELEAPSREALSLAACIGSSFTLHTLALASAEPEGRLAEALWWPVREGLVVPPASYERGELPPGDVPFRFQHDRIQQAAYELIAPEQRVETHLRIGRLLLVGTPPEQLDERLFEIASQLDRGARQVAPEEEARVLDVYTRAARKARASSAYRSAQHFFELATDLLPPEAWERDYLATYELFLQRAECEYLCGHFEQAEALFELLDQRAHTRLERARAANLRLKLYQVAGHYDRALAIGRAALRLLGMNLPEEDAALGPAAQEERREIDALMEGRRISELEQAPPLSDPDAHAILTLMVALFPITYIARPQALLLHTLKMLRHTLVHGNTEESCFAYSAYAIMLVSVYGDIPSAHAFSELSLRLNERYEDVSYRGVILHMHADHVNFWVHHFATGMPLIERAFLACLEAGELVYASHISFEAVWQHLEYEQSLEEVLIASERYATFCLQTHNEPVYQTIRFQQQLVRNLQGRTRSPDTFSDDTWDEEQACERIVSANFGCGVAFLHISRMMAAWYHRRLEEAQAHAERAERILGATAAMPIEATYHFLRALLRARLDERLEGEQRVENRAALAEHRRRMAHQAEHCPANFAHRLHLVDAELARLEGRPWEALRLYELAAARASEQGFIPHAAMAHELAAELSRQQGLTTAALAHVRAAHEGYTRWGALEVARRLEGTWPGLLRLREQGEVRGSQAWALDALSAVKAQRAISSEIVLSELLRTLMRVALENAGAQRGALLWVEGEQVVVESTAGPEQVEVGRRPLTPELLPTSLVAYVRRTGEAVILGSEADRARFSNDSYLRARRPRSVLCLPIFHQRRLVGLLYLENALTPGVFTAGRLAVLEQISAQAAISLENARLYETLERERSLLQAILDHSPAAIYVKDPQGRYLLVNQRLEGLFRRSREAIVGGTDLGLPLDREAVDEIREHDREVLESGTPRTWEEEVRLYGESRTYLSMKFPLRKGKGPVYAVGGIATDITERKREELAERLLAESGRKLAASLEYESTLKTAVGLGVPELAEGCLLYLAGGEESLAWGALATAPEGAELLHGGAAPVALLESLWQERAVQGPVDRVLWEGLEPGLRERLEALAPRWGLYVPLLAHGSRLGGLCLLRCQRAPDERDLALAEELGRRVALALDNARLYRRAQEAIALRDDFLVVASHELRTPLTPLRLQLRRMEQVVCREQPEAPLARMLEGGLRQVDRLERLVKDLLDVSRLSSGRLQLQLEEVDLGELVEAVAGRFERLLEQSGSALRLRVERGVRGRWDGGRVEQVVENLLGNAIKFGEGRPIEMTVEEAPEVARLTVRDHGRGIAGEYHQRIFGRFERAVPTRHYGGLGLGLYITRQLVEAHGGSIQVSSEPGAGATFTVELPRSAPAPRG